MGHDSLQAMPLFFFHLRTQHGLDADEVGTPFPDLDAAYLDVCRAIPEMTGDLLAAGCDPLRCAFEIADEGGRPLMDVPFSERLQRRAVRPGPADESARLDALVRLTRSTMREVQLLRGHIERSRRELARRSRPTRTPFLDAIARRYGLPDPDDGA